MIIRKKHRNALVVTIFLALGFLLLQKPASAQQPFLKKLVGKGGDTTRSSSFIPLPALSYAPETGFEFGLAALYSYSADRKDPATHSSSITGLATVTTNRQSSFKLQADTWSPGNVHHQQVELRYKNFPFNFYGTGGNTLEKDKDVLVEKLFRISQEAEKRIGKRNYAGISAAFEKYAFTDRVPGGVFTAAIPGKEGGKVIFIGASYGLDTRNSNTYTTSGTYLKLNYAYAPDFFGGMNFTGSMLKAEAKKFTSLSKKTVLGLQVTSQLAGGGTVPFYLLPRLGNDQVMRGYYTGRYRDKKLLTSQLELRYRFLPRFGIAGFAGGGKVAGPGSLSLKDLQPTYGAGGRYFFDVERGLSVRADVGFGEKRPGEKRQSGVYISLGEAF